MVGLLIAPANPITEAKELAALDAKMFNTADRWGVPEWKGFAAEFGYKMFWVLLDGKKIGSIAFGLDRKFVSIGDDIPAPGYLYLATTGILPRYQGKGVGMEVKRWQIEYARNNGFKHLSTHARRSNKQGIELNKKFGFVEAGISRRYYENPNEDSIILELHLDQ